MNGFSSTWCASVPLPRLIRGAELNEYQAFLRDESRTVGQAQCLAFPRSTEEVAALVRWAAAEKLPVTVSGARTGITAGAVPTGGLLVCLEKINRFRGLRPDPQGGVRLRCDAGLLLVDIQNALRLNRFTDTAGWDALSLETLALLKGKRFFYPPDPTEASASMGGTVACNASGAHTFAYGPSRPYVTWLEVVLADGSRLELSRGQAFATAAGSFAWRRPDGATVEAQVPRYEMPATKNAAGYWAGAGMDLIDLFIGSEGTLGIVTQLEVRAIPVPPVTCAVTAFFAAEADAVTFTLAARARREALALEAIEYFDAGALDLLRERRRELGASSGVPECLPVTANCAIYVDIGTTAEQLPTILAELVVLVRQAGGDPESAWSAMEKDTRERLRLFRHALPETVNARIGVIRQRHPTVTKLGTDMAVPDAHLSHILQFYRSGLEKAGLPFVIFGHIGDNHLHVNILPRDPAEFAAGKRLYAEFAEEVIRLGGSPAAEHGIGKMKRPFLARLFGREGLREMLDLKRALDPEARLAPGTWFEPDDVLRNATP